MTRGQLVAAEAKDWVQTPFIWQQSVKGPTGGCDCRGLVSGVARELGFPEAQSIYATMAQYSLRKPVPVKLLAEGLNELFDRVEFDGPHSIQPGDVLLLTFRSKAQHLAIATEDGRAVHAQLGPKDWVKETNLDVLLRAYPLHSVYRWRDL